MRNCLPSLFNPAVTSRFPRLLATVLAGVQTKNLFRRPGALKSGGKSAALQRRAKPVEGLSIVCRSNDSFRHLRNSAPAARPVIDLPSTAADMQPTVFPRPNSCQSPYVNRYYYKPFTSIIRMSCQHFPWLITTATVYKEYIGEVNVHTASRVPPHIASRTFPLLQQVHHELDALPAAARFPGPAGFRDPQGAGQGGRVGYLRGARTAQGGPLGKPHGPGQRAAA